MDRKKLGKLQDLLDFAQQDFEDISGANRRSTIHEGGVLFGNIFFLYSSRLHSSMRGVTSWSAIWEELLNVCDNSVVLFRNIIEASKKEGFIQYKKYINFSHNRDVTGRKIYEQYPAPRGSVISEQNSKIGARIFNDYEIKFVQAEADGYEKSSPMEINFNPDTIFDLLEGIPVDRLKTCLECDKIFIQKTARERKYCSDLCKNRHNLKTKKANI